MKKVLILGASSYIGASFQSYVKANENGRLQAESISLRGDAWQKMDWSVYDSVINVTGKAHADIGDLREEEKREYYEINCNLACLAAKKAIDAGVSQYIYFSSIIVYGDCSDKGKSRIITQETEPAPSNFYGDSKWRAEQELKKLFSTNAECAQRAHNPDQRGRAGQTSLAILRPPMIYGAACRGNYRTLARFAVKLPVFPDYQNRRSVLYIENLCEFLCLLVKNGDAGVFFPQNGEYVTTSELISEIAKVHGKKSRSTKLLIPAVELGKKMPGRAGGIIRKAFGSLMYEMDMSIYQGGNYRKYGLDESIRRTEKNES